LTERDHSAREVGNFGNYLIGDGKNDFETPPEHLGEAAQVADVMTAGDPIEEQDPLRHLKAAASPTLTQRRAESAVAVHAGTTTKTK
jgi:hypothetical protein